MMSVLVYQKTNRHSERFEYLLGNLCHEPVHSKGEALCLT
jgi:hypothetical protein